ncbi:MAG: hypothetical protein Q8O76_10115 [Chloroflexota bacterium]|nr:hypothetical protein [Chloroflexota bacterium]
MATPNEIEILKVIRKQGKARNREVGKLMGISPGYAEFLMATMADRGWLRKEKGVGYVLTPVGVDALINEFVYARESLAAKVERMCNQVGRIDEVITRLESFKKGMEKAGEVVN